MLLQRGWRAAAPVAAAMAVLVIVGGCCGPQVVLPAGPYRTFTVAPEVTAPLYLINFDKDGICESPVTLQQVVQEAKTGRFTDVFVISHGWNNDWPAATNLYNDFIGGFLGQDRATSLTRDFRPIFVGIIWPSTLLMTAGERGPRFETSPAPTPRSADQVLNDQPTRLAIRDLAGQLGGNDAKKVRQTERELLELMGRAQSDPAAARQLAEKLAPVCTDDDVGTSRFDATGLVEAARMAARSPGTGATRPGRGSSSVGSTPGTNTGGGNPTGNTPPVNSSPASAPVSQGTPGTADRPRGEAAPAEAAPAPGTPAEAAPAEAFELPDPRWIIRVASVLMMKDRAGVVGANGLGPLVTELVEVQNVRLHMIGHSYGAKVILSAVAAAQVSPGKQVDSMLLLEPAVSAYSFAGDVPVVRRPGKYRPVLDRVRQPLLSTFSKDDWPLTQIYQNFVVRDRDLGEAAAANNDAPPPPPNPHAALGGFGPQPLARDDQAAGEFHWTRIQSPPGDYRAPQGTRVLGLWSKDGEIACHGCVSNSFTWLALWTQVAAK